MLVGRLTKDASVHPLKDERQVVNFDLAINDYYKPKDKEAKKTTTYISCAYWISTKIAELLKKGSIVQVNGRLYVDAYSAQNGKAKRVIRLHVNSIKIHQYSKDNDVVKESERKLKK